MLLLTIHVNTGILFHVKWTREKFREKTCNFIHNVELKWILPRYVHVFKFSSGIESERKKTVRIQLDLVTYNSH